MPEEKQVRSRCKLCFASVMVPAGYQGDVRCVRHGGTYPAIKPFLVDAMSAEVTPQGLIRVVFRQKVFGLFVPSEAAQLAQLLVDAVKQWERDMGETETKKDDNEVKEDAAVEEEAVEEDGEAEEDSEESSEEDDEEESA